MKKIIVIIAIMCMSWGCKSQQDSIKQDYSKGIPYVIPGAVQKILLDEINKVKDRSSIFFMLDKIESNYEISLRRYDAQHPALKWIENTNRYVYVDKKYYPLIFETDQLFSTQKNAEEFRKSVSPDGSYEITRVYSIEERPYRIQFDVQGNIINQGYR